MKSILFRNVTIIDPKGPENGRNCDLRMERGKIVEIAKANSLKGEASLENCLVSPGWVDMRCYLTDPGFEWKDDLQSLAAAAARGGFTAVLCMPNTLPVMDSADLVESLLARSSRLPVDILPAAALTQGTQGKDLAEAYDMHRAGARAFTDGLHPVHEAGVLLRGMQYLHPFGGLLINTPLDSSLSTDAQVAESPRTVRLGMKGIPAIAEEMMLARDLRLMEYFPGRLHVGPVTTSRSLEILREARSRKQNVSAETCAHYLLLNDEELDSFDPNFKLFPPIRSASDTESLREAVLDGTVEVISSGHQPQALEDKMVEFEQAEYGAVALETAFGAACTALGGSQRAVKRMVEAFSTNPRRILDLPPAHIVVDAQASLTFFDPKVSWTPERKDFASKGINRLMEGRKLKGKVLGIFHKGSFRSAE